MNGDNERIALLMRDSYETERLTVILSHPRLAEPVAEYLMCNRDFLREFSPARDDEFYTSEYQKAELKKDINRLQDVSGARFWLVKKENPNKIIGMAALNNIIMGAFKSCFLSYQLSFDELNKGYMTEALEKCISIAFNELGLHRIEANILPRNKPSLRVTEKLGFGNEGLAKKYLRINNVWEDHIHMVLLNDSLED